jgi:hypothetical protein
VNVLKNIGYVIASCLVCTVLFFAGTFLAAVGALISFILTIGAAVGIVALLLKEYFESKAADPSQER